jgi:hypothetical protein
MLLLDIHDAETQDSDDTRTLAVESEAKKPSPPTVMICNDEKPRLALSPQLTTGAAPTRRIMAGASATNGSCGNGNQRSYYKDGVPSNVNTGYRVPMTEPAVTSRCSEGTPDIWHCADVDDAHVVVVHAAPSVRLLGVPSIGPKLSPTTVTATSTQRAALMRPRKLTVGAANRPSEQRGKAGTRGSYSAREASKR